MKKLLLLIPLLLLASSCEDSPPKVCIKSHTETYYTMPMSMHVGSISIPLGDMEQHTREICDQYGNSTSTP